MKKILAGLTGLLLCGVLLAQQTIHDPNVIQRQTASFHAVEVAAGITLYLTQGNQEAVAVSASSPEYRERIKTVVENGVLKISYDYEFWKFWKQTGNKHLKVYVSVANIDGLHASSGSQVRIQGTLRADQLELHVSSGAEVEGAIAVGQLRVHQSSGAVTRLSGTVGQLKVDGSSGSSFRGYDLAADVCEADISSGGGVEVTVKKELSAEASSGGYVHYKGDGVIRNIHTSSGGNVAKRG